MRYRVLEFFRAQDGNAVIDWVVLMTGIVLLAVSVVSAVTANVDAITDGTNDQMAEVEAALPA